MGNKKRMKQLVLITLPPFPFNPQNMNRFLLFTLAYLLNVVSFGQIDSNDTVYYNLGTIVMFEEWTTDHVILPVKKNDAERLGLKGPLTYFFTGTFELTSDFRYDSVSGSSFYNSTHGLIDDSYYSSYKNRIFSQTFEFDFNGKQIGCKRTFGERKYQNLEYVLDKNGFIHKAEISDPYVSLGMDIPDYTPDLTGIEYYKYDSLGNVSAIRLENIDGGIESETFKTFDDQGELIEEKIIENDKIVFWELYEKSNGKIKVSDKLNGDIWLGDLNENGDVNRLYNREKRKTQEFYYEYDSWGNWTDRIKSLNGLQIQEERRHFKYETYAERSAIQVPKPVRMGQQVWMSENLTVKEFRNGDLIDQAQNGSDWYYACLYQKPAWSFCVDFKGNLTKEVLYNYYALTDPRGLAPEGYRIATCDDWNLMFKKQVGLAGLYERLKYPEREELDAQGMGGSRSGIWMYSNPCWWSQDAKRISPGAFKSEEILIFEIEDYFGIFSDGMLIRCVKE
jgi:uncharacterized protein (TIGR02145 family)